MLVLRTLAGELAAEVMQIARIDALGWIEAEALLYQGAPVIETALELRPETMHVREPTRRYVVRRLDVVRPQRRDAPRTNVLYSGLRDTMALQVPIELVLAGIGA